MKELFLPYELAVIAKEKGFNEPVISFWDGHNEIKFSASEDGIQINQTGFLARPLYQQIADWFREKHEIYIHVEFATSLQRYFGEIQERKKPDNTILAPGYNKHGSDINEGTYYEAYNAAITEAFKLI